MSASLEERLRISNRVEPATNKEQIEKFLSDILDYMLEVVSDYHQKNTTCPETFQNKLNKLKNCDVYLIHDAHTYKIIKDETRDLILDLRTLKKIQSSGGEDYCSEAKLHILEMAEKYNINLILGVLNDPNCYKYYVNSMHFAVMHELIQ